MNLRVAMIGNSPGWEELLSQCGVPVLHPGPVGLSWEEFSAIVAARRPDALETEYVREYLHGGGAILGSSNFLSGLLETLGDPVRLSYLLPEPGGRLTGLSLMDIESTGMIPREANCLRTNENVFAVFAGELLGGLAVVAPFDPGEAVADFRGVERYFYARQERLPSERVSRVSKGEVYHFVMSALEYLHSARGLPFAFLSPFPSGAATVCAFRVDTDGGARDEIEELYRISVDARIPFTWFVDAGSHTEWLGQFAELRGQEIGLHCFDHRIFLDAARDEGNIRRGVSVMNESGLSPSSFAAPFGFWSPDLGRAIDRAAFRYSSEFAWAYDSLPHYPVSVAGRYSTLQVPVHPIGVGSLRRCGYTPTQMMQYFRHVVEVKRSRREPLFFYHHPGHRQWDVVRDLCEEIRGSGARAMTMGEYADWWKVRRALRPTFLLEGDSVVASPGDRKDAGPPDVSVCIRREKEELLLPLPYGDVPPRPDRVSRYVPPADIARTREFNLRGEIGRQFTRLQRRFP
jgi:hypothetical protein